MQFFSNQPQRGNIGILKTYSLKQSDKPILTGLSVGSAIATGQVCLIESAAQIDQFEDGVILVTKMTDPIILSRPIIKFIS